nr:cupin domain-containing protein [Prevotella sp. 10(H)]
MEKSLIITMVVVSTVVLISCSNKTKDEKSNNMDTNNMKVTNSVVPKISDFPVGEENAGYAQYFSGRSWLAPLTHMSELNVPMNNVTFEPGCRNNWHSHTGGQILVAVGGVGYYQERGKDAIRMVPGDVIEIAPNIEHWHGAASDEWFSHIAVACNPQTNENIWLEPVSDEEYAATTK